MMAAGSPNARPGRGLTLATSVLADRFILRGQGTIGAEYHGFEVGPGEPQQHYGAAFGQLGTRLMRLWWRDVFGERMPPVGSKRWRARLDTLKVPPPTRGPCMLLSDDSTLLLAGGGALRLSGS